MWNKNTPKCKQGDARALTDDSDISMRYERPENDPFS